MGSNPTAGASCYLGADIVAFQNKDLQVGDLLESGIGEVWMYLGFYEGTPWSMYSVPDFGHMYMFCDSLFGLSSSIISGQDISREAVVVAKSEKTFSEAVSRLIAGKNFPRLRSSYDGNGRYTKSYMRAKRRVGHYEIPNRESVLGYVWGCKRLGDKKPRGYK